MNINEEERGEQLADEIDAADYAILNENEATRQQKIGRSTSPDIILASNVIALLSDSDLSVSISLVSDHLPILITINSEQSTIDGPRRTYINFKKVDWARYAEACDKYLAEAGETRTIEQAEKTFRKSVNKASGLFIPASTITADIAAGFSLKKPAHRTVLVMLDLTAAFDIVDHQLLLDCVFNTNLPATIRHCLYYYMQNIRAKVNLRQKESKSRKVKTGVVQGSVSNAL